jgi:hypothetical protein
MDDDNYYFVQVERLNNTGITTINTIITPINVIQSVDPACDVASAVTVGVGVRFAIAALWNP